MGQLRAGCHRHQRRVGISEACSSPGARGRGSADHRHRRRAGRAVVERIGKAGGKARYCTTTCATRQRGPRVARPEEFGRLDIMVANAGIGVMAPIAEMTRPTGGAGRSTSTACSCRSSTPSGPDEGGRRLDRLMSSIAGLRGAPGLAAYSATKGGVRLLASRWRWARRDSIAQLGASRHHRRRSGARLRPAPRQPRNAPIDPRERRPSCRWPRRRAQDVAMACCSLTEAASYMTGQGW